MSNWPFQRIEPESSACALLSNSEIITRRNESRGRRQSQEFPFSYGGNIKRRTSREELGDGGGFILVSDRGGFMCHEENGKRDDQAG